MKWYEIMLPLVLIFFGLKQFGDSEQARLKRKAQRKAEQEQLEKETQEQPPEES